MTYALAARLAKLEALAQPQTTGADLRRYLRDPEGAPDHARPLLDQWRRFAAASEADAGDDLEAVAARLLEDRFAIDRSMLGAARQRLDEIADAALELGGAVTEPDQEEQG
jgi:hypothetical protein